MNVTGLSHEQARRYAARVADLTARQIRNVCHVVGAGLPAQPTVDDLARIPGRWAWRVDKELMPALLAAYWASADAVSAEAGGTVTAAADRPLPASGERRAATARARLVNLGNTLWETARDQLLGGQHAGETHQQLTARVSAATPSLATARAEAIARSETNATINIAAIDQVRALNVAGTKTWLATGDEHTREDHAAADDQTVPLDGKFDIGGWPMDCPGDDTAPADETDNCRCLLGFVLQPGAPLIAAADTPMTGAMVALVPAAADAKRLAVDGGVTVDQLHLTLFYLGDAADWDAQARSEFVAAAQALFAGVDQFTAEGFGVNYWNPGGEQPAYVLAVSDPADQPGLFEDVRDVAGTAVGDAPIPAQHSPWVPHICLAYSTDLGLLPDLVDRVGPVSFDTARVAFGDQVTDIQLGGD